MSWLLKIARARQRRLRCSAHKGRPARFRVLWADGRGYWNSCSLPCINAWKRRFSSSARRHGKSPDPEIVSIKPIGGRK